MGPGKGGELTEVSCVGSVIAITEMRVAFWENSEAQGGSFLSRKFCRGWSGSAHRGAMREVRAMNQSQAKANSCCEQEPEGSV